MSHAFWMPRFSTSLVQRVRVDLLKRLRCLGRLLFHGLHFRLERLHVLCHIVVLGDRDDPRKEAFARSRDLRHILDSHVGVLEVGLDSRDLLGADAVLRVVLQQIWG